MYDRYEEIEHTADVAIRVHAGTFEGLLYQAALGMLALMEIPLSSTPVQETLIITCSFVSREDILVQALNEVLFQLESKSVVFVPQHVACHAQEAEVSYCGYRWDSEFSEIKAVTYHQMEIIEDFQGLHCMVVFDV